MLLKKWSRVRESNCSVGRRLLRIPWTARRSNQSILKEINPEYSFGWTDVEAEAPILWPPDSKSQLIKKDPDSGKDLKAKGEVAGSR